MEESFSLIVFEEAGSSVRLHDEAQCVAAVAEGRMRPDTRITVYQSGKQTVMAASDFPLFKRLFEPEPSGEEDVAEPDANPSEAVEGEEAASLPPESEVDPDEAGEARQAPGFWGPRPSSILGPDPAQDEAPIEPAPAVPAPTASLAQPSHGVRNLMIVIGVLALLAYCTRERPTSLTTSSDTANIADNMDAIADNAAAAADEDPDAGLPMQTFYAVRDVNLQSRAGASSDPLLLARGSEFTGVVVSAENDSQQKWLKIKQGDNAGRFVWLANLSDTRPPDLDTSFAGFHRLTAPVSLRAAPRDDAPLLGEKGELAIGAMLDIAGKAGDWAEVRLMGGGVAYAPMSAFAEAPQPDEAVGNDATTQLGSTSTPPPPSGHAILLTNRCSIHSFAVQIYYRSEQGWQTNSGSFWTLGRGRSTYPAIDDAKLLAVSDNIYYAVPKVDGQSQNFTGEYRIRYGSVEIQMRKAEIRYGANGDYEIVLDC